MSSLTPSQACLQLSSELSEHPPADLEFKSQHEAVVSGLKTAANDPNNETTGVMHATRPLAAYLHTASQLPHPTHQPLFTVLVDATREVPFWRSLFGLDRKSDLQEERLQVAGEVPPDCILEVARRIVARPWLESKQEEIRSALRIIANCCADNNVNRSVIIRRGGVEAMMAMVQNKQECDLVIPTLYNVCIDYDKPAVDDKGNPWPSLPQVSRDDEHDAGPVVNAAEQKLGLFWDANNSVTSVEILLGAKESAKDCLDMLADLVEMASRVALYGLHQLVRSLNKDDAEEVQGTRSLGLIHSLLTQGADMADYDTDCRVPICQAVLNVLAHRGCYGALIEDKDAIWRLIFLPYPAYDYGDDDYDGVQEPYRKAILKIVYEISALSAYGDKFDDDSTLMRNCVDLLQRYGTDISLIQAGRDRPQNPRPWASSCVLLANSITSMDRAMRLLISTPIASALVRLMIRTSDTSVLVPAVDLATRLALCREGQDILREANMMYAAHNLLRLPSQTGDGSTEVKRQAVTLIRLLIKGRAEYLWNLPSDSTPPEGLTENDTNEVLLAAMWLFNNTDDTITKTETGRLSIEVLRTLFTSPPSYPLPSAAETETKPSPHSNIDQSTEQQIESKLLFLVGRPDPAYPHPDLTIADAMAYIITQPQRQTTHPESATRIQAEAEAWFGLALLSNLPVARPWIVATMHRGPLLERLREIVTQSSSLDLEENSIDTGRDSKNGISLISDAQSGLAEGQDNDRVGELIVSAETASSLFSHPVQAAKKGPDPRYENIKVLVLKLLQSVPRTACSTTSTTSDTLSPSQEGQLEDRVRQELKSAAVELGFDGILA
ncbi:hypothetical protein A1O1_02734 [Capronia coronata CBS 617.96]|uniref:Uncharacterized protein n=1 Tax=Capronia coronata CBS 617.96 TaxID=1182541 RepID=W9YXF8_9EURO|nr:uncharacterized protein A1O1_02734 [Capronia coronata CBS 617.96]EXJ94340.1 hypothetical protein A1O1_02734 [Capronia coronata CBS 617.96]